MPLIIPICKKKKKKKKETHVRQGSIFEEIF